MTFTQAAPVHRRPVDIARMAQTRLTKSSYRPVQTVECRFHDGVLILHGRVPSYFHKQIAQEAIRAIEGVGEIENRIEVRSWASADAGDAAKDA